VTSEKKRRSEGVNGGGKSPGRQGGEIQKRNSLKLQEGGNEAARNFKSPTRAGPPKRKGTFTTHESPNISRRVKTRERRRRRDHRKTQNNKKKTTV